jgi:hypothetical protein
MIRYSTLKLRLNLIFLVGALLFVSCSDGEDIIVYVNDPVPASFVDLPAVGRTGNTFTVTTNSIDFPLDGRYSSTPDQPTNTGTIGYYWSNDRSYLALSPTSISTGNDNFLYIQLGKEPTNYNEDEEIL